MSKVCKKKKPLCIGVKLLERTFKLVKRKFLRTFNQMLFFRERDFATASVKDPYKKQ